MILSKRYLEYFLLGLLGGGVLGAALATIFPDVAPLVFGWPVILLSVLVPMIGIFRRSVIWVVAGAILALPFAIYLGGSPRFRLVGLFLPLLHLAAAFALERKKLRLAWFFLLPYVALVTWLAWSVINPSR
jgi:hypothetical protein